MSEAFQIGLLDFGILESGSSTSSDCIAKSIRLAQDAEAGGLSRYWLAEHHSVRMAWSNTEIAISRIASATQSIRVGAGGLLLVSQNPLRVASDFSFLSQCFPNRIDLGVGRGTPSLNLAALTEGLSDTSAEWYFERQLSLLLGYFENIPRPQSRFMKAGAVPLVRDRPATWLLGAGSKSGSLAARTGLPFALSLAHAETQNLEAIGKYEREFKRDVRSQNPASLLLFAGWCAATEDGARRLREIEAPIGLHHTRHASVAQWKTFFMSIARKSGVREFLFADLAMDFESRRETVAHLSNIQRELNSTSPNGVEATT